MISLVDVLIVLQFSQLQRLVTRYTVGTSLIRSHFLQTNNLLKASRNSPTCPTTYELQRIGLQATR